MKKYISTRGKQEALDFCEAILQGIGKDGGLLVPDFKMTQLNLNDLIELDYVSLAATIISTFVGEEYYEDMKTLCHQAYNTGLFVEGIVPVNKVGNAYIAELFQGPTAAFKDMALTLLPYFMTYSLQQKGEDREVMILAATSGDTGKAALEGFKDVEGTCIKVFYPSEGVSVVQKQQMVTQTGKNVEVIGINGNFDDAQSAVKKAFNSKDLQELCDQHHIFLSSANSINIGRFIPQIIYYFYAYLQLVRNKEINLFDEVNFTIPSGNFGNCLAGYIAKMMGLPIKQLIVASNKNNILTDFFNTGEYNANRKFYKTNAPAMDILVSSNLERLVYFFVKDPVIVNQYYEELSSTGLYKVEKDILEKIQEIFKADWLSEEDIMKTIHDCFHNHQYILDTHTAIAYGVYQRYVKNTQDDTKTIILSTASPYKFPQSVYKAIYNEELDEYQAINALYNQTNVNIPIPLQGIEDREVLFEEVIDKNKIIDFITNKIKEMK